MQDSVHYPAITYSLLGGRTSKTILNRSHSDRTSKGCTVSTCGEWREARGQFRQLTRGTRALSQCGDCEDWMRREQ